MGKYEFDIKEKESIRYIINYFSFHYKDEAIFKRIDDNKLTKNDLIALDSKVRTFLRVLCVECNEAERISFGINAVMHVSVVLDALSKYRSDDFNPDKCIDKYMERQKAK